VRINERRCGGKPARRLGVAGAVTPMSTTQPTGKNSPDTTRDDAPPDIDAYAIDIPQAFVDGYPAAETVVEALELAEDAPSTTEGGMPQCVRCSSVRLSPKSNGKQSTKLTEGYVCENCGTHQSDPEHPEIADIEFSDGQVQLGRWTDD